MILNDSKCSVVIQDDCPCHFQHFSQRRTAVQDVQSNSVSSSKRHSQAGDECWYPSELSLAPAIYTCKYVCIIHVSRCAKMRQTPNCLLLSPSKLPKSLLNIWCGLAQGSYGHHKSRCPNGGQCAAALAHEFMPLLQPTAAYRSQQLATCWSDLCGRTWVLRTQDILYGQRPSDSSKKAASQTF